MYETELSIAGVSTGGEVSSANIWQLCSLERSWGRFILTRNCSRCLSDSGVNSADMGMTSPARIMIALRERSRQNKLYLFKLGHCCSHWRQGAEKVSNREKTPIRCVCFAAYTRLVYYECVYLTCCPQRSQRRASQANRWPSEQCSHLRRCRLLSPFLSVHPKYKHTHTQISDESP